MAHLDPQWRLVHRRRWRRDGRLDRQHDCRLLGDRPLLLLALQPNMGFRRLLGRGATVGDEVDDEPARQLGLGHRHDAKAHEHQQQQEIDRQRQPKTRQPSAKRRLGIE